MTSDKVQNSAWWDELPFRVTYLNDKHREKLTGYDLAPKKEKAKRDLGRIFNAMPKECQDFVRSHTKALQLCGLLEIDHEAVGGVYNILAGGLGEPFTATIRHDYKYRPYGTHTDNRYFDFERVISNTEKTEGMRLEESFSLRIVNEGKDVLTDEVSVIIGEIGDNENNSHISLTIDENDTVTVFVYGYDFYETIQDIQDRFPELGDIEKPTTKWHNGDGRTHNTWKLSIPLEQAKAFRNAVREQIMVVAPKK